MNKKNLLGWFQSIYWCIFPAITNTEPGYNEQNMAKKSLKLRNFIFKVL